MATYKDTILADGPLAYYRLDDYGTTQIQSGTTVVNSGSVGGGATIGGSATPLSGHLGVQQSPAGYIDGHSFHFDNNNVQFSQTINFASSSDFTIEFWYKWDLGYGTKPPVAMQLFSHAGNGHNASVWFGATAKQVLVQVSGSYVINTTISANPTDGNWHHVALTQSAGILAFYIDGVSQTTHSGTTTTANTSSNIQFGGMSSSGGDCWMDEPAFYNKALTQAQLANHYTVGMTAPALDINAVVPPIDVSMAAPAPVVKIVDPSVTVAVPAIAVGSVNTVAPTTTTTRGVLATPAPITVSLAMPQGSRAKFTLLTADVADGSFNVSNSGTRANMITGNGGSFYVKFAGVVIPDGYTVAKATLRAYATNVSNTGVTEIWALATDISDASLESGSSPTRDTSRTFGSLATTKLGWNEWDITELTNQWVSGTRPNYGLAGKVPTGTATNSFATKEATAGVTTAPYLEVEFAKAQVAVNVVDPIIVGSADVIAPTVTTTAGVNVQAPAMAVSLAFIGGTEDNPDFYGQATAITVGLTAPAPRQFIEYNAVSQVDAIYFGNMESEPATVNLTTGRIAFPTPITLSLKTVRPIINGAEPLDRYLTLVPTTLDADDLWYKMDEASGNRALDSSFSTISGSTNWKQSGYYVGTPTYRIPDGPELRPAMSFNGTDNYMLVGPYTQTDEWKDAIPTGASSNMALTVEFSIRTTQQNGVVFIGSGAGNADLAAISQTYFSLPKVSGDELRLVNGNLVAVVGGTQFKVRQNIADGQWHHIVLAIPGGDFVTNPTDPIQFDGKAPSYIAIDGEPVLVRFGNFGSAMDWLPYSVGARVTKFLPLDANSNPQRDPAANGFLKADMRDFIVRMNSYRQTKDTEIAYYEWSNSTVVYAAPMTVSLTPVAPFSARGNVKKMLAVYGLPWGYGESQQQVFTYLSTLTGMVIDNFSGVTGPYDASSAQGFDPVYPKVKTFTVGDYLVYPVDITGGYYASTTTSSVDGVLDTDTSYLKYTADGAGYGGFVDDRTGLPRFINLHEDILNLEDYDTVTVVNYPWVRPNITQPVQKYASLGAAFPPNGQLNQHSMGLSDAEWGVARDNLRDGILEAAYGGTNLWIGEYHAAQHLGFIQGYDVHDIGHISDDTNKHAQDLDRAHIKDPRDFSTYGSYLGQLGHYTNTVNLNVNRRIVTEVAGLTDLPTVEYGEMIQGWSIDRWKSNGDFVCYDIVKRPNGLQANDLVRMSIQGAKGDVEFWGLNQGIQIPDTGGTYGFWNGSLYSESDLGADGANAVASAVLRTAIISARPDGIAGTVVAREQLGYYGDNGVWVDNPYKNNAITIAAEVGTVVRGRAISGRAFIELMETNISPTTVFEDRNKSMWLGDNKAPLTPSTWDHDERRDKEVLITLTKSQLTIHGGAIGFDTSTVNYMDFGSLAQILHKRETMHSRGLHWLAQTPTLSAGDATAYASVIDVTLATPAPVQAVTKNPVITVAGAMRLDLEVEQPANYRDGSVLTRTLPIELGLEMRGTGAAVKATPMELSLTNPAPIISALTEKITVFLDADNGYTTIFLKEDN